MPTFTIFLDEWFLIAAFLLIALGAYMLIFGRLHFSKIVTIFMPFVTFSVTVILLSINGHFQAKLEIEGGPSSLTVFLIVIILLLGISGGVFIGYYTTDKGGLIFMCIINANLISMLIYSFIMSFTGTWIFLVINSILMTALCIYLPLNYNTQMMIQTTSFLGAFMLTRGVSLMVGGYPNEIQTLAWLKSGYVLGPDSAFFAYIVAIALLYLIGQRTQRAQL
jgi:hypothetical protein